MVDVGDGISINTIKLGSGPPLVMLHGMAAGLGFWAHNLPVLAQKHTVYCIDMVGFGRSSRPSFKKCTSKGKDAMIASSEAYFLNPFEKWVSVMGLDKFALLGHSFGGYLSGVYAIQHPEQVRHLILADPWGIPERDSNDPRRNLPLAWRMAVGVMKNFNPLAALRVAGPWGPDLIGKFRGDIREKFRSIYTDPRIVLDYIYHINANQPTGEAAFTSLCEDFGWAKAPLQSRLLTLDPKVPVTLMYGKESWMSRKAGQRVRTDLAPRADYYGIEWAGHHIYADNVPRFNEILTTELDRWMDGVTPKAVAYFRDRKPDSDEE
jgi:pimeloyl-ACP methyl ester carboxylesterase